MKYIVEMTRRSRSLSRIRRISHRSFPQSTPRSSREPAHNHKIYSGTAENIIEEMHPTQSHRSSPKRRVSLCKRWFGFNLCNPWEGGRRTRRYRRASKKQRN